MVALFVSLIINVFVVSVFANSFNGQTLGDLNATAQNFYDEYFEGNAPYSIFPVEPETFNSTENPVDLFKAGVFLGAEYGLPGYYIWAIGLLAAGSSSTITG